MYNAVAYRAAEPRTKHPGFTNPFKLSHKPVLKYSFVTIKHTWMGEKIIPRYPLVWVNVMVENKSAGLGSDPKRRKITG
jgi:hypothetical protein